MKGTLPELQMGSYLAFEALPPELRDGLLPVRVEEMEPVVTLSYEPIPCEALMPKEWMYLEWPHLSIHYRQMLDRLGADRIAAELAAVSERRGNRPLMLLDHDSPSRGEHGDTTARAVFAQFWEEETGEPVPELLADGGMLHHTRFPKRVRPKRPKVWREDRRWRDAPEVPWPPTEEDALRWIGAVHWQTARSPHNPHQYNVREWGPPVPFLRLVQWIRETGETELWGGDTYRFKRIGDFKYWSMGATLPSTIVLNRKPWGADPQDLASPETGAVPAVPAAAAPPASPQPRLEGLVGEINAEYRAYVSAARSAYAHALRCGALLCEARAAAEYGSWLGWLQANVAGSPRTAQSWMKLHRDNLAEGKYALQGAHLGKAPPTSNAARAVIQGIG